jgi:predicted aspartyl protease
LTGLVLTGPRLSVSIGLGEDFAESLLERGETVPEPAIGEALIDSGAYRTCIDENLAKQLGLPIVGVTTISSASHASTQCNLHSIKIEFIGSSLSTNVLQAPACSLASQKLAVLIGRDVLQQFLLVYNGPLGHWTMTLAHP